MIIHEGKTDCCAEEVSYRSENIDELDRHFMKLIKNKKLLSANYLIARHGKIIVSKSMGKRTYKEDSPDFLPESLRYIASISKVFTAIAIMQFVEQGKIYLTQPVSTIIPEFNNSMYKRVTIFHLLTHTSGVIADDGFFNEPIPRNDRERIRSEEWIKVILAGKIQSEPGAQWSYSSKGFLILGEIVQRVSGVPYETYVQNEIITRMNLKDTFLLNMPKERFVDNSITSAMEEKFVFEQEKTPYPQAAGSIISNLYDLYAIGQMFLNKGKWNGQQILSRKSVEAMTQNQLQNVPSYYWGHNYQSKIYGIGFDLYNSDYIVTPGTFGHEGAGSSAIICDPKEDFLFVYITPSLVGFFEETVINPRAIVWSGLV